MPLDEADLQKVGELIAAAHQKAIEATIKIVDERVKPLTTRLDDVEAKPEAKPDKGKDEAKDPRTAELEAKIAALEEQNRKQAEERKQAEKRAKLERLHGSARDALLEAGVPPERVRIALAVLKDEGLLDYDDQGQPGVRFQRKGYSEVLDPKEGVAEWLKSDAGKLFLPAADVGGTGERTGRRTGSTSTGQPIDAETLSRNLYSRVFGG